MKRVAVHLCLLGSFNALVGIGFAQSDCTAIYPAPKVGEYAERKFTSTDEGIMTMRFAIVGEEKAGDRTHYWMEIMQDLPAAAGRLIVQMLIPHYPFEAGDIQDYIVKAPGQPALRVPRQMIEQLGADAAPGPSWREQCAASQDLGMEQVTVPAGTFNARHFRAEGNEPTEVWIAAIPFGMVKSVEPGVVMELVRYGSNASSSIKEKPEDIQLPPAR
jgi:hypothetical protein